jgi:hypothetical protein
MLVFRYNSTSWVFGQSLESNESLKQNREQIARQMIIITNVKNCFEMNSPSQTSDSHDS